MKVCSMSVSRKAQPADQNPNQACTNAGYSVKRPAQIASDQNSSDMIANFLTPAGTPVLLMTAGSLNTFAFVSSRLIIASAIIDSFTKNIQLCRSLLAFAASSDRPENALIVKPRYIHGISLRRELILISGT